MKAKKRIQDQYLIFLKNSQIFIHFQTGDLLNCTTSLKLYQQTMEHVPHIEFVDTERFTQNDQTNQFS